jgi:hypothetical protein
VEAQCSRKPKGQDERATAHLIATASVNISRPRRSMCHCSTLPTPFFCRARYEDAKYLKKENTWKDFIACAQTLMDEGVTDRDRLCIYGASAGGLLIGATLNTAPKREDGRPFFAGGVCIFFLFFWKRISVRFWLRNPLQSCSQCQGPLRTCLSSTV